MAESFQNILYGFILVSLFTVLIIGAVVYEAPLYNKDSSEITGGLNYNSFNDSVSTVESTSQDLRQNFEKQSIWSSIAGIVVSGIFDISKTMIIMIILPFTLISSLMINILHIPVIVSSVILGLLLLAMIFSIWKLIKAGY